MRPPTPKQVAQFLSLLLGIPALHLYLTLAATTGARRGQLLALRWIDVDLVGGSLSIQRSLVEGPDGPRIVPTKTRRSYRVALDAASLELLRGQNRVEVTDGGVAPLEDRFVFSSDPAGTRPWSPNFVTKRFIRLRRAAGLSHFRLHDLRHFMATQMLDAGVPIPIVAARLISPRPGLDHAECVRPRRTRRRSQPQKLCGGGSTQLGRQYQRWTGQRYQTIHLGPPAIPAGDRPSSPLHDSFAVGVSTPDTSDGSVDGDNGEEAVVSYSKTPEPHEWRSRAAGIRLTGRPTTTQPRH